MAECATCSGSGSVTCPNCGNKDEDKDNCRRCQGDGFVTCAYCDGTGQVDTDDEGTDYS